MSLQTTNNALKAESVSINGQQTYDDSVFPFVYECQSAGCIDDATSWIASRRDDLLGQSTRHGAVLLRGFSIRSTDDFDAAIRALDVPSFEYRKSLSNAVRVNRTERVFSANEAPPSVEILFHHEMAQTPIYPARIFFFCEVAAEQGGATPICRSDVLYERLREGLPQFIHNCETKGLQYTNVMPDENDLASGMGRSWRSTLEVDSKEAAESRLRSLNYVWDWLANDCLRVTTPPLPAVMEIAPGRRTFFNQLIAAFCGWKDIRNDPSEAIRHADGSKLDVDAVNHAVEIANELTFDIPWQVGDVALIDNTVTMHARRPFSGTRKVWASLAEMRTQAF